MVIAVANHQCDAGFALDRIVDRELIAQGRLRPGQIATVWTSELIPGAPMVISDRLSPDLRQHLTAALQFKATADYLRAKGFCQGECAIADGDAWGYLPTNDAAYDGVRKICKSLQNGPCAGG